jgi:hypothetical protein
MTQLKDHVRLKPLKPEAGQVMRDYGAPWGVTYKEGIWYVESDDLAPERTAYLATVRMNSMDQYSPKAFNICTRAEAEQIKLYEESGDLEQVMAVSRPAIPPAPTEPGFAVPSEDLNLPAPKSELAAAAMALATARETASVEQDPDDAPPAERAPAATKAPAKAKPKKAAKKAKKATRGRPKTRRRTPGK